MKNIEKVKVHKQTMMGRDGSTVDIDNRNPELTINHIENRVTNLQKEIDMRKLEQKMAQSHEHQMMNKDGRKP